MSEDELLACYVKAIDRVDGLQMRGAANKYTSLNGHMFSFLMTDEGSVAVRFDEDTRAAYAKKFETEPVIRYNATMRGYVEVPERVVKRTASLAKLLEESAAYIATLKPKPTTKKKSTKNATKKKAAKKKVTKKKTAKKAATRKKSRG